MSGTSMVLTGSVADMCRRMRAVLPASWFPVPDDQNGSSTPILDGVLAGMGYAWAALFSMLQYVQLQTRLATATGSFLDIASSDFFGGQLPRQPGDTDDIFRTKLLANLLLEKATRGALCATLLRSSGVTPSVQEPRQGAGLSGYGYGGYNTAGYALGSATMPFQTLITCFSTGTHSTRQSSATYVGMDGRIQLAPTYSLRQDYSNGFASIALVEKRGFNLIKDSIGWTGAVFPCSAANSTTVAADPTAPYAAAMTAIMSSSAPGEYQGPVVAVAVADQTITASIWIKVTGPNQFLSLYLRVRDEAQAVSTVPIPVTPSPSWQRCCLTHLRTASGAGSVTMDIIATATSGDCSLRSQCWQIEPGAQMTSYIPSQGAIGIREADQSVSVATIPIVPVDRFSRDGIVVRTLPAGTVAWIRDIS